MKKVILKLVFGLVIEIVYNFAVKKGKPWADELRDLLNELRKTEI